MLMPSWRCLGPGGGFGGVSLWMGAAIPSSVRCQGGAGRDKECWGGRGGVGGDDGHGWVCGATSVLGDLGQEKRWGL